MSSAYTERRGQIEAYFDRTALDAWARLTSDAPVSGIRATVRAGRDRMRQTLLTWLPHDLRGLRVLDAGCGSGAFAVAAAMRGAEVVAVDLSPSLVELARSRVPDDVEADRIEFRVGDFLDDRLGAFDFVVAMDSLIHYRAADACEVLRGLTPRVRGAILFTFAPSTPLLSLMHTVGRAFPRGDRAPAIEPVRERALRRSLGTLERWTIGRTTRVSSGFYTSQAMELMRA